MSSAIVMPRRDPGRTDTLKGAGLSIALHAILFILGSWLWVRPAHYGVAAGPSAVEVELVAAPSPPPQLAVKDPPVPKTEPEPVADPEPQIKAETKPKDVPPSPPAVPVQPAGPAGAEVAARPHYLRNPAPRYPEASRRNGEEGVVLLTVNVDRSGRPARVDLSRSSGFERLDRAAVESVKRWVFEPARIGSLKVETTVQIPIRFRLDDRT